MALVEMIRCIIQLTPSTTLPQALELATQYRLDVRSTYMGQDSCNETITDLQLPEGFSPPYMIGSSISQSVDQLKARLAQAGNNMVRAISYYHQDKQIPPKWQLM